jgi:hypothetical protein
LLSFSQFVDGSACLGEIHSTVLVETAIFSSCGEDLNDVPASLARPPWTLLVVSFFFLSISGSDEWCRWPGGKITYEIPRSCWPLGSQNRLPRGHPRGRISMLDTNLPKRRQEGDPFGICWTIVLTLDPLRLTSQKCRSGGKEESIRGQTGCLPLSRSACQIKSSPRRVPANCQRVSCLWCSALHTVMAAVDTTLGEAVFLGLGNPALR